MRNLAAVAIEQKIKIVTINTWKCDGDYRERLTILAKQLAELNPDIIACQECFVSDNADTLRYLSEILKMGYAYLPGREKKRYFESEYVDSGSGLGVLSKYPIADASWLALPVIPEDNDRKIQQVEIMIDETRLYVTNTHFTHLRNEKIKRMQAETLASFVLDKAEGYHIICGDFNSEITSEAMEVFMKKSNAIDCYSAGGGEKSRYSLLEPLQEGKKICVDHIFSLPFNGSGNYPEFINSAIVLNEPDAKTGIFASDHFGITTTLVIHG
jgi:endonuclease/exonuclease/phosphatase family metal-dependent hydrolase